MGQNFMMDCRAVWLVHLGSLLQEAPWVGFFQQLLATLGQPQRKRITGFNQGRSLLAGCAGSMEGHGTSDIAVSILERTDVGSQVAQQ